MNSFLNNNQDCLSYFKECPLFDSLDQSELELISSKSAGVNFRQGEIIYKQGTPLTHMVLVHSGYGKIYLESGKKKNLILCYTRSFDLNGGVGVFIDQIHHSSLVAVTDSGTCFIDINAFNDVTRSNEKFRNSYLRNYSERVLHIYYQFTVLTQKNMEGRMAESILYLGDEIFENGSIKNVSNQDLAELTAMTRESAIRVLKAFRQEGLIEMVDHTINVIDKKALEKIKHYG